jgi:hypothetical protein
LDKTPNQRTRNSIFSISNQDKSLKTLNKDESRLSVFENGPRPIRHYLLHDFSKRTSVLSNRDSSKTPPRQSVVAVLSEQIKSAKCSPAKRKFKSKPRPTTSNRIAVKKGL